MSYQIIPGRGRVKVSDPFTSMGAICHSSGSKEERPVSTYERTKAQVYATGNKWAVENFNATHD